MADRLTDVVAAIREHDDFLVAAHYNPDGDALGSMAAMGWILSALGKRYMLYNISGIPSSFDWIPFPMEISSDIPKETPGCIITLDCGDAARTGPDLRDLPAKIFTINIDHHLNNPMFGAINWVETGYSSTGEMVSEIANALDVELSGSLAESIYLALVTDTGNFSYDNSSPKTMRLAAQLVENGVSPGKINDLIQNQWSLERIQLMRYVLGDLELHANGRIGLIKVRREMFEATGASVEDTEGLINYVRKLRGVKIAIALREEGPAQTKFSLRSSGDTNVQKVAASFGGGGHKNASGGQLKKNIDSTANAVVKACTKILGAA